MEGTCSKYNAATRAMSDRGEKSDTSDGRNK